MTKITNRINSILVLGVFTLILSAMTVSGKPIVDASSVHYFFKNVNQMASDHNKETDCLTNN